MHMLLFNSKMNASQDDSYDNEPSEYYNLYCV